MPFPPGSSFIDIDLTQVDARSPVDDDLMYSVAEDLYFLKNAASASGGLLEWNLNGDLDTLRDLLPFKRFDGGRVPNIDRTLTECRLALELPGNSGTLEVDVRKYRSPNTPITAIDHQYSAAINSITRVGTSINTQSITRATVQISTQSITFWKAAINVNSIVPLGGGLTRYNLASAPDSDWIEDSDYVTFTSCTSASNNGTFRVIRINDDGAANVVVQNTGVVQTSAAGTAQLQAMSYDQLNPVNGHFAAGEKALFASHTSAVNDGDLLIYAINAGGNNIIVKNRYGVTQGGVAGTVDTYRFAYTYLSAVASDYVVGETAFFQSHTSSANDGHLPIRAVNSGGNNIIVYNALGVLQGGIAGTADTDRWIYALPSDPSSSFSVSQTFKSIGATDVFNNGVFSVVEVNHNATNNLVVYNTRAVTQAGAVGNIYHTRKLLKFSSDQSAIYSTLSRVKVEGVGSSLNFGEFDVVQVNRGGGANYNVVVDIPNGVSQANESGRITFESRSVFSVRPTLVIGNNASLSQVSSGTLDATEKLVKAGRTLYPEIIGIPLGNPENLTVSLM